MKVIAIGDLHDSPHIPNKERFRWIGKHIQNTKPDYVVQIGDFCTLDSCTYFIPDDSYSARIDKPTFIKDMESLDEAMEDFSYGLGKSKVKKFITLGNHEKRMWRYEDKNPTFYGMCQKEFYGICSKYGWDVVPWSQYLMLGGVGFVHAPINPMGKEYGGETSERQIANKSKIDIVFGHSHRAQDNRVPKISDTKNDFTRVLNIGCALPEGYIENYAKHSLTGWTYQICELEIWDNHIMEVKNISMRQLKKLYG